MKLIFLLSYFSWMLCSNLLIAQHVIYYREFNNGQIGNSQFVGGKICDTTAGGNYIFAGSTGNVVGSSYVEAVINKNGSVLWENDSALYDPSSGDHGAYIYQARRTLDNGIVFCGNITDYTISTDPMVFICKTDSMGNELWRKTYAFGYASDIYLSPDSSLLFVGSYNSNNFLLKLKANGDSMSMFQYSLLASDPRLFKLDHKFVLVYPTYINGVNQTSLNAYSITTIDSTNSLINTYSSIDTMYSHIVLDFCQTSDNHICLITELRDTAHLLKGTIIQKVDTQINVIWQDTIGHYGNLSGGICELPNGNILAGNSMNVITMYNPNGNKTWIKDFSDTTYHGQAYLKINGIYPLDTTSFLISGLMNVQAPGGSWFYLTKIGDSTLTAVNEIRKKEIQIYPNPSTSYLTIKMDSNNKYSLTLRNLLGQPIYEGQIESIRTLDLYALTKGVYILEIQNETEFYSRRIVVNN